MADSVEVSIELELMMVLLRLPFGVQVVMDAEVRECSSFP